MTLPIQGQIQQHSFPNPRTKCVSQSPQTHALQPTNTSSSSHTRRINCQPGSTPSKLQSNSSLVSASHFIPPAPSPITFLEIIWVNGFDFAEYCLAWPNGGQLMWSGPREGTYILLFDRRPPHALRWRPDAQVEFLPPTSIRSS